MARGLEVFSELLTPDDVTGKLLVAVFAPAAAIVTVVLLVKLVAAWLRPVNTAASWIDLDSVTTDLTALRTGMRLRSSTVVVGVAVTALLVLVQVVWLWSASQVAHGLSYLWNAPFGTGRIDLFGLTSDRGWDWISATYLVASAGALAAAYASAYWSRRGDVVGGASILLSLPLMLPWGLFCLVGALFELVMVGIRAVRDDSAALTAHGRAFVVVTLVVALYTVGLHVALGTARTIIRYWRRELW